MYACRFSYIISNIVAYNLLCMHVSIIICMLTCMHTLTLKQTINHVVMQTFMHINIYACTDKYMQAYMHTNI